MDITHILATASFADAEARAECERRIIEAVKAEREECAKIVEKDNRSYLAKKENHEPLWFVYALERAAAIRARQS